MKNIKITLLFIVSWLVLFWSFLYAWNAFVWSLLWTQLEIWLSQRSNTGIMINWEATNALTLHQEGSLQSQYDLISELDKAETEQERLQIIDQYIALLSNYKKNGTEMYNYEQSQVDYYKAMVEECENPIKAKNLEFSDAVKTYCVARNEVYVKAHSSYASTVKSLNSLQNKIDYLSENKGKIAKYYEILKPDLLKELYDISKTVESDF